VLRFDCLLLLFYFSEEFTSTICIEILCASVFDIVKNIAQHNCLIIERVNVVFM